VSQQQITDRLRLDVATVRNSQRQMGGAGTKALNVNDETMKVVVQKLRPLLTALCQEEVLNLSDASALSILPSPHKPQMWGDMEEDPPPTPAQPPAMRPAQGLQPTTPKQANSAGARIGGTAGTKRKAQSLPKMAKVVVKKVKNEPPEERWAANALELSMINDQLLLLIRGKELTDMTQSTYTKIRQGRFSTKHLKSILATTMAKMGLQENMDAVASVAESVAEWATALTAQYADA
jgi:hypothetical protein